MQPFLRVDQRIRYADGRHGTIRFVGVLPGLPDQFIGIEFDLPNQGKHDGSFKGTRIFGPTKAVNAGSFFSVNQVKLLRSRWGTADTQANSISTGITLSEAIVHRYGDADSPSEDHVQIGGKTVEMVLSDRIPNHSTNIMSLVHYDVVCCDSGVGSVRAAPVTDLDLSYNMIWDIAELFRCLNAISPSLQTLNLSHNPLRTAPVDVANSSLTTLVLNHCHLNWDMVCSIASSSVNLRELHVSFSGLGHPGERLELALRSLNSIRYLSLDENPLNSWNSVSWLGSLPYLEKLLLNKCCLGRIDPVELGSFPALIGLSLSDNLVSTWSDIQNLATLSKLRDLRIQRCPVTNSCQSETVARLLVLGRLPELDILNGSSIAPKDKEDAEKYYLQRILNEVEAGIDPTSLHPRYAALRSKYPDISFSGSGEATSTAATFHVRLCSPDGAVVDKTLPESFSVAKLISLFQRTFFELKDTSFTLDWADGLHMEAVPHVSSLVLSEIAPNTSSPEKPLQIFAKVRK